MHRFVWDLRHEGATDPSTGRGRGGGPLAVPGQYRVRLTVGDWGQTQTFELAIDPRVAADGITQEDLIAQLELSQEVQALLDAASTILSTIDERLGEADDASGWTERLRGLRAELATDDDMAYPQPMLVDQIRYLYAMITSADQPPGVEAYERHAELKAWLARVQAALEP